MVFAAVVLAGCSRGSTVSSSSTSTIANTATTVSTPTTQDLVADKQAASTVVILAADAGPGFTGTAHDRSTDDDVGSCVNHDPVLSGTTYPAQADGEDLANSGANSETDVRSSVRVAPSVEAAKASMAAAKAPGALTCFSDLFKASSAKNGLTVADLTVSRLGIPMIGDDVFAFKAEATITQSGTTVHLTQFAVLVRKGRILDSLTVNGLNVVPALDTATTLAKLMATRSAAIK